MTALILVIGGIYLLFGLGNIATALYLLAYGPSLHEGISGLFVAIPLVNAAISLLIAYAFFRLKAWGRYLVIAFNGVYLVGWLIGPLYAHTEPWDITPAAMAIYIAPIVLLGGIIAVCLIERVRTAMTR